MMNHPLFLWAAAAAAALLFLQPFPVYAADEADLQSRADSARSDYQSASDTLNTLQQQAEEAQQQVDSLQTSAQALRSQLADVVAGLAQSRLVLDEAQNAAAAAEQALADKQAEFDAQYAACKEQIAAMQILGEGGSVGLLMQAQDLYDLLTFWEVLNDLTARSSALLETLEAQAEALDEHRQAAQAAAKAAADAAAAWEEQEAGLNAAQAALTAALAEADAALSEQQAAAEAQAAVAEEKRRAYEQATAELDAYLKAQSQKYSDPERDCSLDFGCPLPYVSYISTHFGESDAVYGRPHTGADLPAAGGTPIYAAADGVVSAASTRPSYGNCVQIDHGAANGNSYATLYAHMSSFSVSTGQEVSKGQVIGYVGNTGDVRGKNGGYHLHLELRINGSRVDPLQYIPY